MRNSDVSNAAARFCSSEFSSARISISASRAGVASMKFSFCHAGQLRLYSKRHANAFGDYAARTGARQVRPGRLRSKTPRVGRGRRQLAGRPFAVNDARRVAHPVGSDRPRETPYASAGWSFPSSSPASSRLLGAAAALLILTRGFGLAPSPLCAERTPILCWRFANL
jgi:hypothetical protein